MASLLFYLSASVLFAQSTFAFNCSQPPIYVDIHKRAVRGTDVFQYGAFIGVGNPAQNQSLWPSLRQNQTAVASINYCDKSNLTDCAQSTRGNFDPSLSTTYAPRIILTPLVLTNHQIHSRPKLYIARQQHNKYLQQYLWI